MAAGAGGFAAAQDAIGIVFPRPDGDDAASDDERAGEPDTGGHVE